MKSFSRSIIDRNRLLTLGYGAISVVSPQDTEEYNKAFLCLETMQMITSNEQNKNYQVILTIYEIPLKERSKSMQLNDQAIKKQFIFSSDSYENEVENLSQYFNSYKIKVIIIQLKATTDLINKIEKQAEEYHSFSIHDNKPGFFDNNKDNEYVTRLNIAISLFNGQIDDKDRTTLHRFKNEGKLLEFQKPYKPCTIL